MTFNREPVVLVQALLVPLALAVILFLHLGETLTDSLNVLVVALGGAVAALGVGTDKILPLLGGLAKAIVAVVIGFGGHVSDDTQVLILTGISIIVAYLTRPQVTPKASYALTP